MRLSGVLFFLCQFTGISSLVIFMTTIFEVSYNNVEAPLIADPS